MYPNTFTVEKDGKFTTIRSCSDALGVARGLFRLPNPVKIVKKENETIFNDSIKVTQHEL